MPLTELQIATLMNMERASLRAEIVYGYLEEEHGMDLPSLIAWYPGVPCGRSDPAILSDSALGTNGRTFFSLHGQTESLCDLCYAVPAFVWGRDVLAYWCERTAQVCTVCQGSGNVAGYDPAHPERLYLPCPHCQGNGSLEMWFAREMRGWNVEKGHNVRNQREHWWLMKDGGLANATPYSTEAEANFIAKRKILRLLSGVRVVRGGKEIGEDERCKCNCADRCPLGRVGSQYRCTRAELECIPEQLLPLDQHEDTWVPNTVMATVAPGAAIHPGDYLYADDQGRVRPIQPDEFPSFGIAISEPDARGRIYVRMPYAVDSSARQVALTERPSSDLYGPSIISRSYHAWRLQNDLQRIMRMSNPLDPPGQDPPPGPPLAPGPSDPADEHR